MSNDEHDGNRGDAQRKHTVESYVRGAAPLPSELACAPRLQGWRACIVRTRTGDGRPRLLLILTGRVSGHPRLGDGSFIHTSEVIWLDRCRNWARSWNRLYRLGTPDSDGADPGESEA